MIGVSDVGLVESINLYALFAMGETEKFQEVELELLRELFNNLTDIRADSINVANMAFRLGMLLECILVAALF